MHNLVPIYENMEFQLKIEKLSGVEYSKSMNLIKLDHTIKIISNLITKTEKKFKLIIVKPYKASLKKLDPQFLKMVTVQ